MSDGGEDGSGVELDSTTNEVSVSKDQIEELIRLSEEFNDFVSGVSDSGLSTALHRWSQRFDEGIWILLLQDLSLLQHRFSEMLSELAQKQERLVKSEYSGFDIFVRSEIVETVALVLVHAFRNIVSHGIESPAERQVAGKTATARVKVGLHLIAGQLRGEISDDGRGPSIPMIRKKVIDLGLASTDQALHLSEVQVLQQLFEPRMSTAVEVDRMSGLGVGLSAVRQAVLSKKGQVSASIPRERVSGKKMEGFLLRFEVPIKEVRVRVIPVDLGSVTFFVRHDEAAVHSDAGGMSSRMEKLIKWGLLSSPTSKAVAIGGALSDQTVLPVLNIGIPEVKVFRQMDLIWQETGPDWLKAWFRASRGRVLATRSRGSAGSLELGILVDGSTLKEWFDAS